MNETKHTPLPWHHDGGGLICDRHNNEVARLWEPIGDDYVDVVVANAALIVRAVNSHEALLEACKRLRQELHDLHSAIHDQGIESRFIDDAINMLSEGHTAIESADAIIALAEGQPVTPAQHEEE